MKRKQISNSSRSDVKLSKNEKRNTIVNECDEKSNDFIGNTKNDKNHDNNNNKEEGTMVPLEIDTHFQMYGKHAFDVEYGERCPLCNKRIDEYGFCACGSGGE